VPGKSKDVYMGATRRRFALEYRIEAAHRVIDSNRSVAEAARDLFLVEATLARWVREERRRVAAASDTGDTPPSATERAELVRLRKKVSEQEKDLALCGESSCVLRSQSPKQKRYVLMEAELPNFEISLYTTASQGL